MLRGMNPPLPSLIDTLAPLSEALDALTHAERVNWTRGLARSELRALYALAAQGGALPLGFFYGEAGAVVRHHGTNSLPVFSTFEKRLVLLDGQVQGYNHNPKTVAWFTGPGHFLARQDGEREVLFDYTALPTHKPAEFPDIRPNDTGTARLVFGGMVDRVRRVSRHCTIGAAFRGDKAMNAWFTLVREGDPPAP